jgi:hypothetical protein
VRLSILASRSKRIHELHSALGKMNRNTARGFQR